DDGQRRERPRLAFDAAVRDTLDVLRVDARGTLEQARVQIEHVARIRLAARRTAQEQRDLPIRPGLLRQVVVDDQRVFAVVPEELAHGAARVGRDVLHGRGLRRRRRDDDRVLHRAVLFELAHDVRDGRVLLADRDVDADEVLALLVDDRVDRDGALAGLAVADDELALTAADRDHRVDGLQARLHGLADGLTVDDARRDLLDRRRLRRRDRALAVDRIAERVDDAADQLAADRHLENA